MKLAISSKTPRQLEQTPILQQTAYWSKIKEKQGLNARAFDLTLREDELYCLDTTGTPVHDDLLLLQQDVGDGYTIAYVPYGPTIEPCEDVQGEFLEELSESLRCHLGKNCIMIRYDLLWESFWARDSSRYSDNEWLGPPEKRTQEIRFNFATRNWNLRKANTNLLPRDTVFINLGESEEKLLARMKPKTRYNIGLSRRRGVRVRKAEGDDLAIWYDLYRQTCARNNLYLHDLSHFQSVLSTRAADSRSPAEVELMIAESSGTPLAAMFLVLSGKRATYLYGASSSAKRHLMAPYLLQWEAMREAKQRGCLEYDLFGISPRGDATHPMYGLYRFKTGFGGYVHHRMGCWDYPLNRDDYAMFQSLEMNQQGYHLH